MAEDNTVDPQFPDNDEDTPTLLGLPLNRIVAFLGPYISAASGTVAAWLLVHVHFLSLFHLGGDQLAQGIAQLVTFAVVTLVTWLGHQKWLHGYQEWEAARLFASENDLSGPVGEAPLEKPVGVQLEDRDIDEAVDPITAVADGEEFAAPPDPDA